MMQELKSHVIEEKCPSFYKEKIKDDKKVNTFQNIIKKIGLIFKDK